MRTAKAMPDDRLDWQPSDSARSALDLVREIALSGAWFVALARGEKVEAGEDHAERERERAAELKTLEECETQARRDTSELCAMISRSGSEQLEEEVKLPFGGGMTVTKADLFGMHYSHLVYHSGQINYIQTLYGDAEMH